MKKAYLGIDIAKSKFDVVPLLNGNLKAKSFSNSVDGFDALLTWLQNHEYQELHICMESTGIYGEN